MKVNGKFSSIFLTTFSIQNTNIKHGNGKIIWPDGSIYEGQFERNQANGKGRFLSTYGLLYEGDFYKDKIQGFGVLTVQSGARYEGQWQNNLQNGKGKEIYEAEGTVFVGNFMNGVREGYGYLEQKDGYY